ncbi:MAG: ABC transporter ATP-binding protein [Deltaproteobacteria bacterium]|nr:ABC transporter ATP-binding protein [Deltaproteobacteria bacterium]MBW2077215.1 ABC transporter ATP-binding protein [Deltaproteobacteria bacterium]MBW2311809.1 ABC transporter ATP-binding protein [Deltaproteobacteria bacterium]RLB31563.1 MAG: ABC transporter ATP-binding protein [Deltaproteobacteria bacterium]
METSLADNGERILETRDLTKTFGGLTAVNGLSLNIERGEIRGIIGPNGSGKTTLINLISGIYRASSGAIYLDGARIDRLKPNVRTSMGIIRTFQIPKVFRNMTVLENMLVPAFSDSQGDRYKYGREVIQEAEDLLRFVQLYHMRDELAKTLSGGQIMLLQIARGFIVNPLKLYLMDEPFAGVNPQIKGVIMESIKEMNREKGVTFIIVSHEMPAIRRLCGRVSVMHEGRRIAEGSLEEVANIPAVIDAYIGG